MGRAIIKIKDKYFMWSTVTDSPITYGMSENELVIRVVRDATINALEGLKIDLDRVKENGHCFIGRGLDMTLDDVIEGNRAGENESELTMDEIYERYQYMGDDDKKSHYEKHLIKGIWVSYAPGDGSGPRIGRVKDWNDDGIAFVVYECDHEWNRYEEYEAVPTEIKYLMFFENSI